MDAARVPVGRLSQPRQMSTLWTTEAPSQRVQCHSGSERSRSRTYLVTGLYGMAGSLASLPLMNSRSIGISGSVPRSAYAHRSSDRCPSSHRHARPAHSAAPMFVTSAGITKAKIRHALYSDAEAASGPLLISHLSMPCLCAFDLPVRPYCRAGSGWRSGLQGNYEAAVGFGTEDLVSVRRVVENSAAFALLAYLRGLALGGPSYCPHRALPGRWQLPTWPCDR